MGPPMYGEFKNGRGELYAHEPFKGRAILTRFVFDGFAAGSARDEQAFSDHGGKTWEVNWINTLTHSQDHG